MGEGTFGKVYLMGLSGPDMPVLKMVPVGGDIKVNDGNQAGLTEMLSEVVISNTLSILCNGAANCTQGFVDIWSGSTVAVVTRVDHFKLYHTYSFRLTIFLLMSKFGR